VPERAALDRGGELVDVLPVALRLGLALVEDNRSHHDLRSFRSGPR
jgi:hypothetical protein